MGDSFFSTLAERFCESDLIVNRRQMPTVLRVARRRVNAHNNVYTLNEHTLIKAVTPWLFNKKHIEICFVHNKDRCSNELDMWSKLLRRMSRDAVARIRQCRVIKYSDMAVADFRIFFTMCKQLKSVIVDGYSVPHLFEIAVRGVSELRKYKRKDGNAAGVPNADIYSCNFLGMRDFMFAAPPTECKHFQPWIKLVSSLENITSLSILNGYSNEFIDNCDNLMNLHHARFRYSSHKNIRQTFLATTSSHKTLPVMITLDIWHASIVWEIMAGACPLLKNIRITSCIVLINVGYTHALSLTSLQWRYADRITGGQIEGHSLLRQLTSGSLRKIVLLGPSDKMDYTREIRTWINNPRRLVGCDVTVCTNQYCRDLVVFRANRRDRIRLYLLQACMPVFNRY